jgi:hypothetical protein
MKEANILSVLMFAGNVGYCGAGGAFAVCAFSLLGISRPSEGVLSYKAGGDLGNNCFFELLSLFGSPFCFRFPPVIAQNPAAVATIGKQLRARAPEDR